MIPLRSYYSCHSGVASQVVTRSMAKRRAVEMQTLEMSRKVETVISEPLQLDLPNPANVTEEILGESNRVSVAHVGEIGSEAREMQTLEMSGKVETVVSESLQLDLPNPTNVTEKIPEELIAVSVEHVEDVVSEAREVLSGLPNFEGDFSKDEKGLGVLSKQFSPNHGPQVCLFVLLLCVYLNVFVSFSVLSFIYMPAIRFNMLCHVVHLSVCLFPMWHLHDKFLIHFLKERTLLILGSSGLTHCHYLYNLIGKSFTFYHYLYMSSNYVHDKSDITPFKITFLHFYFALFDPYAQSDGHSKLVRNS